MLTANNRGVEAIIRERGAVPATVAILQGRPHVGLTAHQLEALAEAGPLARKCSRRDLAVAIAQVCGFSKEGGVMPPRAVPRAVPPSTPK